MLTALLASFGITACATLFVRMLAWRLGILDQPKEGRKIHSKPTPFLGGVAVYVGIATVALFILAQFPHLATDSHVTARHLIGILAAGLILVIGGTLDDRYNLKPWQQIISPVSAIFVIIASGIGVSVITNPFSGATVALDTATFHLFTAFGYPITISLWSDVLTFVWLLGTIYTTKFLDGLDGLVSGMTVIGGLIIGFLSLLFFINIPTALLSFVVVGAFAGFLVFNFHPASIFLGESGSTLAGLLLGTLAILSGAKFATALLILAIPILDAAWVIFRRAIIEKRSPLRADRKHIHFRLLDAGFSHRQAVFLLYAVSAAFGIAALFMQTAQKLFALAAVAILMLFLMAILLHGEKRKSGERFTDF